MSKIPGVLGPPQVGLFDNDVTFETQDYAIGGKMVTVKTTINALDQLRMSDAEWKANIRQKLANQLSLAMLDSDLVETTSLTDPSHGQTVIAARCYLAPNDQVKILRVHKR